MPAPLSTPSASSFYLIQPLIDTWEGGYVDHPQDPGGPTNRGITQATLSRWLKRPAHRDDVRALTKSDAWEIMKAYYFDVIRADELPSPVAAMTYNAAILSGPKRGITFLQNALNRQGIVVKIDGLIGPETIEAANKAAPRLLASAFADVQEAYLRALPHFPTFGKGWLRRLDGFRQLAKTIPLAAAKVRDVETSTDVTRGGSTMPGPTDSPASAAPVMVTFEALQKALHEAQTQIHGAAPAVVFTPEIFAQIQTMLDNLQASSGKNGLGPVNAALGEAIGNLLNGRKSAIGIIGALLTFMTTPGGLLASLPATLGLSAGTISGLLPVFLALSAWGAFGKAEKWSGGSR